MDKKVTVRVPATSLLIVAQDLIHLAWHAIYTIILPMS